MNQSGFTLNFRAFIIGVAACAIIMTASFSLGRAGDGLTEADRAALAEANNLSRAFVAVAKLIRPAVVNIKVERRVTVQDFNNPFEFFNELLNPRYRRAPQPRSQISRGQGSGVIIDAEGYILTNNHVVGDADAISVVLLDGREFPAELIGTDPSSEVAVIKVEAENLTVAALGDSDLVEVGEWVVAVGNPFGLDFTVTNGIISARGRSGMGVVEIEDFIQTDASINPGNSGGPLVNLKGEVIGINTFIATNTGQSAGVGFAIPSNIARSIMRSLISHKQVITSYLGVETQPLTAELAQGFGLQAPRGALIRKVNKDSPGEKAGLRRGDVVVRWGRREILDDQQLRNLVTISTPGEPIEVEVVRQGENVTLSVVLVESPEEYLLEGKGERFFQSLGIAVAELTPEIQTELGYEAGLRGMVVLRVERGSLADRLGMVPGSVIMSLNGKEVGNQQEMLAALETAARTKIYDIVWRTGMYTQRYRFRMN
ncbi:MAG: Do family serine endopeptidase [Planctomycetes bacterium]|nr:Do family serine endopeptidase [Planctomycetota bacterium]